MLYSLIRVPDGFDESSDFYGESSSVDKLFFGIYDDLEKAKSAAEKYIDSKIKHYHKRQWMHCGDNKIRLYMIIDDYETVKFIIGECTLNEAKEF